MHPWQHMVRIPEAESGSHRIEHFTIPAGEKIQRGNLRTAFMGGQYAEPLVFPHPTIWHRLCYEGGVWMTDLPIEQEQHDQLLKDVGGRVLVGGLGLGYAANLLAANPDVEEVTVVELTADVIKLVEPHLIDPDDKVAVVNMDLHRFLAGQNHDDPYDYAFFDIWQQDSLNVLFNVVIPLREAAHSNDWCWASDVICWNENVMRGQLMTGLASRCAQLMMPAPPGGAKLTLDYLCEKQDDLWHDWSVPFWQVVRHNRSKLGDENGGTIRLDDGWHQFAGEYAGTYGFPGWRLWLETKKED